MSTLLLRDFYLRNPAADVTGLLGLPPGDRSPYQADDIALWREFAPGNDYGCATKRMLAHLVVDAEQLVTRQYTDAIELGLMQSVIHFRPTRAGWRAAWRIARMLASDGFAHVPDEPGPALLIVDLCADHQLAIGEVVHRGQP